MITALTPTGARPEAFSACVDMMRAQTITTARWVIVDDGPEPVPIPEIDGWEILHLRPAPLWVPEQNTQRRNLLFGLKHCTDRIAIIEDDDAYANDWLETCNLWLDHADIVGESQSLYRHIETGREFECNNDNHASLCSTAVKGLGIDALERSCSSNTTFIDIHLWKRRDVKKKLYPPDPRRVVGIKGYPGRPGIGMGHKLK